MQKSPLDELFNELYGYYPSKPGQAFEMIVAAAFKLMDNSKVAYNQFERGTYSKSMFQLDGVVESPDAKKMIEVKDYMIDGKKVGRGDLQKLQGALTDLPVDEGIFASATGFSKPAVKYADSAEINPRHKPIELFHIRPSDAKDEEGRVQSITISSTMIVPDYRRGTFEAKFPKKYLENEVIKDHLEKTTFGLSQFYDVNGNVILTINDFSKNIAELLFQEDLESIYATWLFENTFVYCDDMFLEILGLTFNVPIASTVTQIIIEGDGTPRLYVRSADGKIDKLIYDEELKKIKFEDGIVYIQHDT